MQRYKVIAIAVAVVVLAAAVVTVVARSGNNGGYENDGEINLVSGLEGVGTGFYYDPSAVEKGDLIVLNDDGSYKTRQNSEGFDVVIFNPKGWEGLVFGIPSIGSIQYYQLKTIVEDYLADKTWTDGTTADLKLVASEHPGKGEVGFLVTGGSASAIKEFQKTGLKIGVTWDPQFSALTYGDGAVYSHLVTTDMIFPHVTCCVLYGNSAFIHNNPDASARLVWAAKNATDWLNAVFDDIQKNGYDPSNERHAALMEYAIKYSGGKASGLTQEQILNSLKYIEYAWGDGDMYEKWDPENPLTKVKTDIANQTDTLYNVGGILKKDLKDLGFSNSKEFADSFVYDEPLKKAIDVKKWDEGETYEIRMSAIASDIHQIPMHLANEKLPGLSEILGNPDLDDNTTLYEQAGIEISFKYVAGSNAVVTQLQSGEADFGVAAQPAVIIYDINNSLTKA